MNVIIIDDEDDARSNLRAHINEFMPDAIIMGEADSVRSAVPIIKTLQPDAIFIDIQLGDGTGFDILDNIEKIDFFVIFVTAYDKYAIKSFKYAAVDYILKPIDADDFKLVAAKLNKRHNEKEFHNMYKLLKEIRSKKKYSRIAFPCKDGTVFIALMDIISIQSNRSGSKVLTKNGECHYVLKNLKSIEELLPKDCFFRPHQSHIINLKAIVKFNKQDESLILNNGINVPVSRRSKDELLELFGS